MENILYAVILFVLLGALLGIVLAFLAKVLHVPTDPRKDRLLSLLPCANCGACGKAGCSDFAEGVLSGDLHPSLCKSLTRENEEKICTLCGASPLQLEKCVARVLCVGGTEAKEKYLYEGIEDCRIAASLAGGNKLCHNGCTGLGNCVRACAFDALHLKNGVAEVTEEKCVGCGACVDACPKGIITMLPAKASYAVLCRSCDKGPEVVRACNHGCIGCKKCEKICESGAILVKDFCAEIDQSLCTGCGKCAEVCPRGIIRSI